MSALEFTGFCLGIGLRLGVAVVLALERARGVGTR
jgi:hypothetical protein